MAGEPQTVRQSRRRMEHASGTYRSGAGNRHGTHIVGREEHCSLGLAPPGAYWAIHLSYTFLAGGFIGWHCSDDRDQNPALILFLVYVFLVVPPWAIVGTVFGFNENPFEPPDHRYGLAPAIIISNLATYLVAFGVGFAFFEWKKKR